MLEDDSLTKGDESPSPFQLPDGTLVLVNFSTDSTSFFALVVLSFCAHASHHHRDKHMASAQDAASLQTSSFSVMAAALPDHVDQVLLPLSVSPVAYSPAQPPGRMHPCGSKAQQLVAGICRSLVALVCRLPKQLQYPCKAYPAVKLAAVEVTTAAVQATR